MLIEDFLPEFAISVNRGDVTGANNALMKQLGNNIVKKRQDFVDLLNESGIKASINDSDSTLVKAYIDNISTNKQLAIGTSLLVHFDSRDYGADGASSIDDQSVKAGYNTLVSYFTGAYSNVGGPVADIAMAVKGLTDVTGKVMDNKKKKNFGVTDSLQAQQDAKAAIAQQVIAQRQAQLEQMSKQKESEAKTTRILLIAGGSVIMVGIIAILIYKFKKK